MRFLWVPSLPTAPNPDSFCSSRSYQHNQLIFFFSSLSFLFNHFRFQPSHSPPHTIQHFTKDTHTAQRYTNTTTLPRQDSFYSKQIHFCHHVAGDQNMTGLLGSLSLLISWLFKPYLCSKPSLWSVLSQGGESIGQAEANTVHWKGKWKCSQGRPSAHLNIQAVDQ